MKVFNSIKKMFGYGDKTEIYEEVKVEEPEFYNVKYGLWFDDEHDMKFYEYMADNYGKHGIRELFLRHVIHPNTCKRINWYEHNRKERKRIERNKDFWNNLTMFLTCIIIIGGMVVCLALLA